jgi:SAM-dependent methyltransferase
MSSCCGDRESAGYHAILPGTPSSSIQECGVQKRLDFVLSCLDQPIHRLLDVGCGSGAYLDALSSQSTQMVGVDPSSDHLNKARRRPAGSNVYLGQMVAERLAFADDTFSAIILIETLEHIVDGPTAIVELARVLRPGGQLIVSVPNKLFPVETHSIQIGGKVCGSRWGTGTPLLPLLPRCVRRRFATARLYYSWELRKLLADRGFLVSRMDYLMPSLDSMEQRLEGLPLARWLRRLAAWLERSPFRVFGSTIVLQAKRCAVN